MVQRNIDALKLQFMREFLEIQDIQLLQRLLEVIRTGSSTDTLPTFEAYDHLGNPIGETELLVGVAKAKHDRERGKLHSIEDMEMEIESWK